MATNYRKIDLRLHPEQWVNSYTKDELVDLCLTLRKLNETCEATKNINNNYIIWNIIERDDPGAYILEDLKQKVYGIENRHRTRGPEYRYGRMVKIFAKLMFDESLENLPLYLNKRGALAQAVVKWRFDIGK